jgi:virginiamycin B lyase
MDSGFYPHTVRFDAKDRVWFTLALSNQVGMYDRAAPINSPSTTCRFAA